MATLSGSFLVARPLLRDPSFCQSVVLLLQHGAEGAFGLVVNRPKSIDGVPFAVYTGGPCDSEGLLMLHGQVDWLPKSADPSTKRIAPGIYLGDANCLEQIQEAETSANPRFRLFAGYAGWAPQQLENELASGAWAIVAANGDLLFDTPAEQLWENLMPPSIPQPSLN